MEEINIGDTVRFLNAIGGGKVTAFKRGGIVLVEDEDGFEIPVRQSEVCLVSSSEKKLTNRYEAEDRAKEREEEEEPTYRVKSILATAADKCNYDDFDAPRMASQQSNAAQATKPATPSQGNGHATPSQSNGHATPESKVIESLEARIIELEMTVRRMQVRIERLEDARSMRDKLKEAGMKLKEDNRRKKDDIIEVDLHATEILDNTLNLSAADIKEYQLEVFRRTMNENKNRKGQRIVFIHGNGDGVLRRAIIDELRRNYKTAQYQDASFQQYGFGATMVII